MTSPRHLGPDQGAETEAIWSIVVGEATQRWAERAGRRPNDFFNGLLIRLDGAMDERILRRLEIVQGDIVEEDVDGIVNAANSLLLGGGGVDGAIHRAAGPELLEECRGLGGCPTGEARITKGYRLRARHVIHTVGPVWSGGARGEAELLSSAYRSSLALAAKHGLRVVSFPAISTGVYRYPKDSAARIALRTTSDWLAASELPQKVRFVVFSPSDRQTYEEALKAIS